MESSLARSNISKWNHLDYERSTSMDSIGPLLAGRRSSRHGSSEMGDCIFSSMRHFLQLADQLLGEFVRY
jgi:fluoride exporter